MKNKMTNYDAFINKLKTELAENMETFFDVMDKNINLSSKKVNKYFMLKGRYKQAKSDFYQGILIHEEKNTQVNNIRIGLLDYLDSLKSRDFRTLNSLPTISIHNLEKLSPNDTRILGDSLLKKIFGKALTEAGDYLADSIRYRRLRNQIKILQKVEKEIKDKPLNNKSIPLKILFPLINDFSLEESDLIQDKWAKLISTVLTENIETTIQKRCIDILKQLTSVDAKILNWMYFDFLKGQKRKRHPTLFGDFYEPEVSEIFITKKHVYEEFQKIEKEVLSSSLTALELAGVIVKSSPEVFVESQKEPLINDNDENSINPLIKNRTNYEEKEYISEIEIKLYPSEYYIFTEIGKRFMEICKKE